MIGRNYGDLLVVVFALGLDRHVFDGVVGGLGGVVDATLHRRGIGPGGDVAQAIQVNRLRQHRGGGGAIARDVGGLLGDLVDHLRAHVFEGLRQFDLLGDGHAVLGDRRPTKGFLQDDVAAGRPHGDGDGPGDLPHAGFEFLLGRGRKFHLFGGHYVNSKLVVLLAGTVNG